jgi:hypothetical protein
MKRRKENPALGWEEISIVVPSGKGRKILLQSPLAAWGNIVVLLLGMRRTAYFEHQARWYCLNFTPPARRISGCRFLPESDINKKSSKSGRSCTKRIMVNGPF